MQDADERAFEAALDAWIAERASALGNPENLTREEALKVLAAEALTSMGLLPLRRR